MHDNESLESAIFDLVMQHGIVSVTNVSGRIALVSDAFCQLSGFDRNELVAKSARKPTRVGFAQMLQMPSPGPLASEG
jgi:PAS domain-containing protein